MPIDQFGHGFGLKRDVADRRDRALFQAQVNIDALPVKGSAKTVLPPVMDQGPTNSCVGFSGATVLYGVMKLDKHIKAFVPSPVFLYREARALGGYVEEDSGTEIRLMWKAANRSGMPPISAMKPKFDAKNLADPFSLLFPEKSIWRKAPTQRVYDYALQRQAIQYFKLFNLGDVLQCLANGWPLQAGLELFTSFYGPSGPLRLIPDPKPTERSLGFHAVTAYAYDRSANVVFWRNQWGKTAHEGTPDFITSFNYVEKYYTDAWTCRLIEGGILSPVK